MHLCLNCLIVLFIFNQLFDAVKVIGRWFLPPDEDWHTGTPLPRCAWPGSLHKDHSSLIYSVHNIVFLSFRQQHYARLRALGGLSCSSLMRLTHVACTVFCNRRHSCWPWVWHEENKILLSGNSKHQAAGAERAATQLTQEMSGLNKEKAGERRYFCTLLFPCIVGRLQLWTGRDTPEPDDTALWSVADASIGCLFWWGRASNVMLLLGFPSFQSH